MNNVEVEIVDSPVRELFAGDGPDTVAVVEGVPEFGDEKEVFALYEAFLDCARDTLAGFDFVAVVWVWNMRLVIW